MKCACHSIGCKSTWSEDDKNNFWFKLQCGHNICVPCFSKMSADRGCDPFYQCPLHGDSCHRPSGVSWKLCSVEHSTSTTSSRSGKKRKQSVPMEKDFAIREPILQSEPKQYHQNLDSDLMMSTCTLSVTAGMKDTSSILCIAAELKGDENGDDNWDEDTKRSVEQIFQVLHPFFVVSGTTDGDALPQQTSRTCDDYFSANDETLAEIATIDSEKSILHRCFYALGKGELVSSIKNDTVKWKNLLCQTFTASDLIRNMARGTSGKLKRKVAGQLIACGASKALWKVLTRLGVAPSQEFIRLGETQRGLNNITNGLQKDRHDLIMMLYDNIGFRRKGSTPNFEQFTALQLLNWTKWMLQEMGIYPRKGCDIPPLSRVRKVWADIREETSFDQIMGIDDGDNDRFASSIVKFISALLDQESRGMIPSTAAARNLLYTTENRKSIEWVTGISEDQGVRTVNEGDANSSHVVTRMSDVLEEDVDKFQTSLERNNAIVDRPMKADLNSKSTVKSLMNYALDIRRNVLDTDPEDDWWDNITPIMEDIELPLLGDGSPTYAISTILRTDEDNKYRGKVKGVGGGFHLLLEAHRKCGSLFSGSHLIDIFSSWRTTPGQLNWVLDPGDPGQIDAELVMYILALYVSAIRAEAARKAKVAEGEESFDLSPSDIIDSMVKRAMEEPLMLVILTQLRLAELTFMLHEAEKKGDASIYITAQKYLAILFATTHATKYVSMSMDFFVDLFCSSDADKKIFEKAFLTRETKNGKKIFTDRFVEWMMKDLRSWLGKTASQHTESLLERCALNLNNLKRERSYGSNELNSTNKSGSDTTQLALDHVFLEVLVLAEEANLFGDGPLRHVKKGPANKRNNKDGQLSFEEFEEDEKFTTIGSTTERNRIHLNKEMLSLFELGRERLEDYYKEFLQEGDLDDPKRSEKKVSLAAIDPLKSASDKEDTINLDRSTSTDMASIANNYTVEGLKREIQYLNQKHLMLREENESLPQFESIKDDGTKNVLVSKVVILRNDLIAIHPSWASERLDEIREQMRSRGENEDETMQEKMEKELGNKVYTLNGATAKNEGATFTFQVENYISMDNDDSSSDDDSGRNNPRTVTFADDDGRRGRERNNPRARDRESMGINSELGLMDGFDF